MIKTIKITENEETRADLFITTYLENISRSQVKRLFDLKRITVNGSLIKPSYKLKENDLLEIRLIDDETTINPINLNLEIVYEDDDIIVINKPKNLNVHPSISAKEPSVVHHLLYHTKNLSTKGGTDRPGIVHRLDKQTSGLMVVAKNDFSYDHLVNQFKSRTVKRLYEAVCYHPFTEQSGTINAPIGRDKINRVKMAVTPIGKEAITEFKVLNQNETFAHLMCNLKTGRTHQIRVHLAYIKHPIVGDLVYGKKKALVKTGQALHAKKLEFIHPSLNKKVRFQAPIPKDFRDVLILLNLLEEK